MTPTKPELKFTYEDYLLLPEEKQYELIDGGLYIVPAPRPCHQVICRRILVALSNFVDEKELGQLIPAPCDVYFSRYDVVQPDILYITSDRLGIIKEKNIQGPPDLAIEIISPADPTKDRELKRTLYARYGVREYWIVDPAAKSIEVLTRQEGDLKLHQTFVADDWLTSTLFEGFQLSLPVVFDLSHELHELHENAKAQMQGPRRNADLRGYLAQVVRQHWSALGAYVCITVVMTSPFVSLRNLFGTPILEGDPGYSMWAISWVNHALLTQPQNLFAANILYPTAGTLALSDHAIGVAVLVHPWFWFSDNPILPYNLLFLLSYFASAVGMYLLCFHYTQSRAAAFVGGLIYGFCFFRAHHFGHLTLISNQWFPFVILLFHRLRERFRWSIASVWIGLLLLQLLSHWYNAAFIVLILTWVMVGDFVQKGWDLKLFRQFAFCMIITALLIFPFIRPYSRLPKSSDYSQNKAFAADLGSYFQPPLNTQLGWHFQNTKRWIWEERSTFIGYIPLALALAGSVRWRRTPCVWTYASLAAVAFVLSLGPESLDFPGVTLPAYYVYKLFPPLVQLRAGARLAVVVTFCLSVLAAMACSRIPPANRREPASASVWRGWWMLPVCLGILLEYFPVHLGWDPSTAPHFQPRAVDLWLRQHNIPQSGLVFFRRPKQRDRKVVVELPDYNGTAEWSLEALYMLYSTQHWMSLVNGYTRFLPPNYLPDFSMYARFPSDEAVRFMKQRGIDYVVIHADRYPPGRRAELGSCPLLETRFGNDWVYSIR